MHAFYSDHKPVVLTTGDACRLQGKIMYELQEYQASGKAYNALLRLHPKLLPAWKGLAELYTITNNDAEAVEVYEKLVSSGSL